MRAGGNQLDNVTLDAEGTPAGADFSFSLANQEAPALGFEGAGRLELADNATRIELSRLDGKFEGRDIRLRDAVTVTQSGASTSLKNLKLDLAGGEVTASADLTASAAQAEVTLAAIPLELLTLLDPQLKTTGTLGGKARVEVIDNSAQGAFEFSLDAVKPEGPDFENLPPLNGRLTGQLDQGRLAFAGQVTGFEATNIDAEGSLPLEIALDPFVAAVPETQPLEAALNLRGDLAGIWPLLALDEHLLAGELSADLSVTGTLGQPEVTGTAALSEGRYENLEAGTLLTDL